MPLENYGVLKGKAIDSKNGVGSKPHFQILIIDNEFRYRIAVNVKSGVEPSVLYYYLDEEFDHPIREELENMPFGFHLLESIPGGISLDYIRGNFLDCTKMKLLPHNVPGPDNDLNELIHKYISRAIGMENSEVYAFGERWGPEEERDRYFGFKPGNGIHDIHMNQGNSEKWEEDNGVWQDGGLIIHLPDEKKWVAIYLAFQSQCFHTDDISGNKLPEVCDGGAEGEKDVQIIAALVNPEGPDLGLESVILLNTTPGPVDLTGWALADKNKKKENLSGVINPGEAKRIKLSGEDVQLSNKGGIITLLDDRGIKVHGVKYTKEEASRPGWTIVF